MHHSLIDRTNKTHTPIHIQREREREREEKYVNI